MIELVGFAESNYYNKVKLVLLEKGVPFGEVVQPTPVTDPALLLESPFAKIPILRTERGPLSESQVIIEYLEQTLPEPALLPRDPYEAAKLRELITHFELYVEWVARPLYVHAFAGGQADSELLASTHRALEKNLTVFARSARFAPYVAGTEFSLADCAVWPSLPVVALASRIALGVDLVAAAGIDLKAYNALIGQRESAQRVTADRKARAAPRA